MLIADGVSCKTQAVGLCCCRMPTVLRRNGFKVVINSDDHRPAHVHIIGGSGIVIIKLNGRHQKPSVRENLGTKAI
jgi:hypothetical protein